MSIESNEPDLCIVIPGTQRLRKITNFLTEHYNGEVKKMPYQSLDGQVYGLFMPEGYTEDDLQDLRDEASDLDIRYANPEELGY